MDWNLAYTWLVIALLLGLGKLASGALVLLALAAAAMLTAALAWLGLTLPWQLLGMGVFSGVLVPLAVMRIRPAFSPRGVAYGTTGTGVEKGHRYTTLRRDFDDASGIKINGALYYQIIDPKRAVYEVANMSQAVEVLAKTTLRSVVGKMELDKLFESRGEVNNSIQTAMEEPASKWGVKISRVEVQDIAMPEEVETAMRLQMAAERSAQRHGGRCLE